MSPTLLKAKAPANRNSPSLKFIESKIPLLAGQSRFYANFPGDPEPTFLCLDVSFAQSVSVGWHHAPLQRALEGHDDVRDNRGLVLRFLDELV
jgi:hypothetical protein